MGNPTVTPIAEFWHDGGFIVAEEHGRYDRAQVTILSGAGVVYPGTVLGAELVSGSGTAAALGTNTGNGTFGAITVGAAAAAGVYTVEFDDATHFIVSAPNGAEIGHGTTGVAFSAGGLGFTITAGGSAFVPGDSFTVTVTGSYQYAPFDPTQTNGLQNAAAIIYGKVDATSAAKQATAVVRGPVKVNSQELVWGANVTTQNQKNAAIAQLQALGILCMGAQPNIWG